MKRIDIRALLLSVLLLGPPINYYLNIILQYGYGMNSISMITYIIMALLGLYSYKYFNQLGKDGFLLFALLVMGFMIAALVGGLGLLIAPDYNPLDSPFLQVFLYCFPLFILTKTRKNFSSLLNYLFYFALINLILFIPAYYFCKQYLSALNVDYMSISYNVLVALCICLGVVWDKRYKIPMLIAIICLLLLIVIGSRGASISALIYLVLLIVSKLIEGEKRRVLIASLIFATCVAALGGYYYRGMTRLVDSGEIYSRNLTKLDDNSFFSHEDRDEIKKVIEIGLDKNPFGYGLLGDRIIMQNEHYESVYAHNLLLELRADFGIIIGPIIFVFILLRLIKSLFRFEKYKKDFLIMIIPAGFIKLWFSDSFLIAPEFYCLLALIFGFEKYKKEITQKRFKIIE